jgi:hypothetical protein
MDIDIRITLPQHDIDPAREPVAHGAIVSQVMDWIADGLFPEESVVQLVNDGFGNLRPDGVDSPRQGRFTPDNNLGIAPSRRTFR